METITHHTPAGTSTNTVLHYAQEINSKTFTHYDYGEDGNLEHYGDITPPLIDMRAVNVPISSYWSDNDWLAQPAVSFQLQSSKSIKGKSFIFWKSVSFTSFLIVYRMY